MQRRGEPSEGMYGIIKGGMRYSAVTASGYETSFMVAVPGDWEGDMSSLDGQGRAHDGFAVGPLRLALLGLGSFEELLRTREDFRNVMIRTICASTRDVLASIDTILASSPDQLLAWRISEFCVDVAGEETVQLTQDDLAALVGVSRQSVNKILRRWSKQGLVDLRYGRLTTIDMSGLRALTTRS